MNAIQRKLKENKLNGTLQEEYQNLKINVTTMIRTAKREHYNKEFTSKRGDIAATWRVVRQLVPDNNSKDGDCLSIDDKVDQLNTYFANVGKNAFDKSREGIETNYLNQTYTTSHTSEYFRPQPINESTVILIIKNLKETQAYGSDGIPLRFLKDALPVIVGHITCIINTSLVTGAFPTAWKHSLVTPVHKSGAYDDPNNYRPISLLSILSKILEKTVAAQLSDYLESKKLLSDAQHGFRPGLSTVTALTKVANQLYENIDNKKISLLTLCDLSKAFDSVSHDILLKKMYAMGVDVFWFKDYLTQRTQSVRVGEKVSTKLHVSYGVPQGSVLGPILFTMFVNDLATHINHCLLIQYADDTQFITSDKIENLQELIKKTEDTLKTVKIYFNKNGLLLNSKKTQCMFIGNRNLLSRIPSNTVIRVNDNLIQPSQYVKNLGLYFDQHMVFDKHISQISRKTYGTLMYVNRIKEVFSNDIRRTVIQTLVLSIVYYGMAVWGTTNKTQIKRVQKLQNFCAKVIVGGKSKRDHASPILDELDWLKISKMCAYEQCIMTHKAVTKKYPGWLFTFPTVHNINTTNTRQRHDLYVPRTYTDTGQRSLLVRGPRIWNALPLGLTKIENSNTFKKCLKKYLLHNDCL